MKDLAARTMNDLMLDLPLACLRIGDERLNAIATEFLVRLGVGLGRRLTLEAASAKTPPGYRVRLLHVIQRLGFIPDEACFLDLFSLTHNKNAKVRAAAAELICTFPERRFEVRATSNPPQSVQGPPIHIL